jgi:hypothetical protein
VFLSTAFLTFMQKLTRPIRALSLVESPTYWAILDLLFLGSRRWSARPRKGENPLQTLRGIPGRSRHDLLRYCFRTVSTPPEWSCLIRVYPRKRETQVISVLNLMVLMYSWRGSLSTVPALPLITYPNEVKISDWLSFLTAEVMRFPFGPRPRMRCSISPLLANPVISRPKLLWKTEGKSDISPKAMGTSGWDGKIPLFALARCGLLHLNYLIYSRIYYSM